MQAMQNASIGQMFANEALMCKQAAGPGVIHQYGAQGAVDPLGRLYIGRVYQEYMPAGDLSAALWYAPLKGSLRNANCSHIMMMVSRCTTVILCIPEHSPSPLYPLLHLIMVSFEVKRSRLWDVDNYY